MKFTPTKCPTCEGAGLIQPESQAGVIGSGEPFECPDCDGTGNGKPRITYHVGDKVRILKPQFVRRVGYPLVWYEVEDAQLYRDVRIGAALAALGLRCAEKGALLEGAMDDIPRHLQRAFAMEWVAQNRFGGNERTIHYHPAGDGTSAYGMPLNWTCGPTEVLRKRVVKTGTRFAPYVPGAWAGPDAESEPGGLADCKTHVLLDLGMGYEIEARNVEPWK